MDDSHVSKLAYEKMVKEIRQCLKKFNGSDGRPAFGQDVVDYMIAHDVKSPSRAYAELHGLENEVEFKEWEDPEPREVVTKDNLDEKVREAMFGFDSGDEKPGGPVKLEEKEATNSGPKVSGESWDELKDLLGKGLENNGS